MIHIENHIPNNSNTNNRKILNIKNNLINIKLQYLSKTLSKINNRVQKNWEEVSLLT